MQAGVTNFAQFMLRLSSQVINKLEFFQFPNWK